MNFYHITGRTYDRENFPIPINVFWQQSIYALGLLALQKTVKVHAFVLMPNHFHLLLESNALDFSVPGLSSLECLSEKIPNRYIYRQTYRYVALNPVRGGLCQHPHHYPYSTFSYVYSEDNQRKKALPFFLYSGLGVGLGGKEGELFWLKQGGANGT